MDLNQSKLSKSEWETIEKPVSESEMEILKLIVEGYQSPNIRKNKTKTFLSYTKIEKSPEIDYYVFRKFFEKNIHESIDKYAQGTPLTNLSALRFMEGTALKQLKSIDSMRIKNTEKTISNDKIIELGHVINGTSPARTSDDEITVVDLTGVAVQDIQIASAVLESFQNGT